MQKQNEPNLKTDFTNQISPEIIFKCCFMDCEEKFVEKIDFIKHLSKHTLEKTFKCDFCTKTYICPLTLRIHVDKVHTELSTEQVNNL